LCVVKCHRIAIAAVVSLRMDGCLPAWKAQLDVDAMFRGAWRWQAMNPRRYEAA